MSFPSFAQTDKEKENIAGVLKSAKDNFIMGRYKVAVDEYLLLLESDSNNLTYYMRVGVCYLYSNIDKSKSIYYFEKVTANPKGDVNAWYELGRAYLITYNIDKAITCFEKYKQITNGKEGFEISSDRMLQMCEEARRQIANPVNVTIENIGPEINSPYADYYPYVPNDESFLVFSSKRAGNTGSFLDYDGNNTADVYISYQKYDKWSKAKGVGNTINSTLVEETAGLSSDGTKLFVYSDNFNAMGQILLSTKKLKAFQKPEFLGTNISSSKFVSSGAISPNKKILIFSCDKNEAAGGMDLFMSRKLPSGKWGVPENLGAVVNTIYDEEFPYFASDGKTLYFSSQGHNSMGGYDIFKTIYDENSNTWSEPVNIGYPINTTDNDFTISLSATGRHGYISSPRPGGYGDIDIYKVIFNDVDPAYTILSGEIVNTDSICIFKVPEIKEINGNILAVNVHDNNTIDLNGSEIIKPDSIVIYKDVKVDITVTNINTMKKFGKYLPNKTTGKYLFVLPPGDYKLEVNADGYSKYSEVIKVFDRSLNCEIFKDIVLLPLTEEENKN